MIDMEDDEDALYITFNTQVKFVRLIENTVIPSRLAIKADVLPHESATEQDLQSVMLKVKFWLDNIVSKAIAFSHDNSAAIEMFIDDAGKNRTSNIIMITPGEPSDEVFAALFQSKLTALANGAIEIGLVEVKSDNPMGLAFTFVGEGTNVLPTMKEWIGERSYFEHPWWMRNDASTLDLIPAPDADLTVAPPWAFSLDTLMQGQPQVRTESGIVVRPSFNPTVINGGKTKDDE